MGNEDHRYILSQRITLFHEPGLNTSLKLRDGTLFFVEGIIQEEATGLFIIQSKDRTAYYREDDIHKAVENYQKKGWIIEKRKEGKKWV